MVTFMELVLSFYFDMGQSQGLTELLGFHSKSFHLMNLFLHLFRVFSVVFCLLLYLVLGIEALRILLYC